MHSLWWGAGRYETSLSGRTTAARTHQWPGACDFSTQGTNIGRAPQGLLTGCQFAGMDRVEIAYDGASGCYDGNFQPFGMPGDLWIHSCEELHRHHPQRHVST
jgi:hypothetical protein